MLLNSAQAAIARRQEKRGTSADLGAERESVVRGKIMDSAQAAIARRQQKRGISAGLPAERESVVRGRLKSTLVAAAACVGMALCANAQQLPTKVGVINVQGAIVGTKDGQKASQELQTKFNPKKKEFDTRQSEIAQLQDQYNKGGTVMSEDKRNQLARDIDEKKKRLERDMQDANEELQGEQQRILGGLGQRMMAVIEKYAKDNGYTVVLDDSSPNTPLLYASSSVDITQDIIQLYDKTSSNGGPVTPSASTPGSRPNAVPGATVRTPGTIAPGTTPHQ